jgi:hypothetical protein
MQANCNGVFDSWRRQVIQWCDAQHNADRRLIKVVFDPDNIVNNASVADLIYSLDRTGNAVALPCSGNTMTIMQRAMDADANKAYTIVLPQATQTSKRRGFYAALESLADGVVYLVKPKFSQRQMNRPQIIVFTRAMPNYALLAARKWDIYKMTANRNLVAHINKNNRL